MLTIVKIVVKKLLQQTNFVVIHLYVKSKSKNSRSKNKTMQSNREYTLNLKSSSYKLDVNLNVESELTSDDLKNIQLCISSFLPSSFNIKTPDIILLSIDHIKYSLKISLDFQTQLTTKDIEDISNLTFNLFTSPNKDFQDNIPVLDFRKLYPESNIEENNIPPPLEDNLPCNYREIVRVSDKMRRFLCLWNPYCTKDIMLRYLTAYFKLSDCIENHYVFLPKIITYLLCSGMKLKTLDSIPIKDLDKIIDHNIAGKANSYPPDDFTDELDMLNSFLGVIGKELRSGECDLEEVREKWDKDHYTLDIRPKYYYVMYAEFTNLFQSKDMLSDECRTFRVDTLKLLISNYIRFLELYPKSNHNSIFNVNPSIVDYMSKEWLDKQIQSNVDWKINHFDSLSVTGKLCKSLHVIQFNIFVLLERAKNNDDKKSENNARRLWNNSMVTKI